MCEWGWHFEWLFSSKLIVTFGVLAGWNAAMLAIAIRRERRGVRDVGASLLLQ
ncbi:MAG: hypothetical protein WCP29_15025 [Acidobacteriota bacterium]